MGSPPDTLDPPPADGARITPVFRIDVQYDQALGDPTRVCIDASHITSDDEFGFVISDFKLLSKVKENSNR